MHRVVVVGAGAAAVTTAAHLLAVEDGRVEVGVVADAPPGPGLAYRTTHPQHLLNNIAARLSLLEHDPGHLVRWCARQGVTARPETFLSRRLYGDYLRHSWAELVAGGRCRVVRGAAHELREGHVVLGDGRSVEADTVVLAPGNPPPGRGRALGPLGRRFAPDPWSADLSAPLRTVLLVGTGLTMVDLALQVHDAWPDARITAASRTGRLPAAHRRPVSVRDPPAYDPGSGSFDSVVARVRRRVTDARAAGRDWRDVVDGLRPRLNDVWQRFPVEDQRRFVDEVARDWELVRHRMAPEVAEQVGDLRTREVLRVTNVAELPGAGAPSRPAYDLVIDCTGPLPVPTRGWNPLVDRLLGEGAARAHPLGLGLDLTPEGRVVARTGRAVMPWFVVGAARRGLEWEVTAVPDLRRQAVAVAEAVRSGR